MPIFRTNEGLTPDINTQVYDDGVLTHFSRFSKLFAALAPYRKILMEEANSQGLPLVRHPILQFPDDRRFLNMTPSEVQFMLGDSIMVAPKLTPRNRKTSRKVILPAGEWIELWTGELLSIPAAGAKLRVTPALGEPPVYLLNNARTREIILPALGRAGIIPSGSDRSSAGAQAALSPQ